ncbi:unannotated protein [freshwater metagenome]|uniref:Unannotated protein n=1 Tax=freshwater metagenome TaxID=449393 RepID=A0A6J6YF20_9ZZZZ
MAPVEKRAMMEVADSTSSIEMAAWLLNSNRPRKVIRRVL